MKGWLGTGLLMAVALTVGGGAQAAGTVRAVISRASAPIKMDGKLDEWAGAFAMPVNFGHADWANRAAVWRWLWDEQNLYVSLECLDTAVYNKDPGPIYDGDGVEFYLDVRDPDKLGAPEWAPGTIHLFFTGASNGEIKPRIQIRPNIPAFAGFTTDGMECAAARTAQGYSVEFRLPWSKFPGFKPEAGREIGIDCELCSSDGGPRVDRCWVFSGVAAVGGPAAFGRVRLVDAWDPVSSVAYSDVLFPTFLARGSPLNEPATIFAAISPAMRSVVKGVEMRAGTGGLPFVGIKEFGPGWARAQGCLVGFVPPEAATVEIRFLADGRKVVGSRSIPLKP